MSEHQITVEQLIEVARTMSSTETLRRKLEKFAAQQRADATRELQREKANIAAALEMHDRIENETNAENEKLRAELAPLKAHFTGDAPLHEQVADELNRLQKVAHDQFAELAAVNECARINAENSHYWHGEAIAAKQQLAEADGRYKSAFAEALKMSWQAADGTCQIGQPGSYWRGQNQGMIDGIKTVQSNFEVALNRRTARTAQAVDVTPVCTHLRRTTHKSVIDGSVERDRCDDCGEVLSIGVASAAQDQDKGADNEKL